MRSTLPGHAPSPHACSLLPLSRGLDFGFVLARIEAISNRIGDSERQGQRRRRGRGRGRGRGSTIHPTITTARYTYSRTPRSTRLPFAKCPAPRLASCLLRWSLHVKPIGSSPSKSIRVNPKITTTTTTTSSTATPLVG